MFEFLLIYAIIGLIISFILNAINWANRRPAIGLIGLLACVLFWPSVIAGFINSTEDSTED